MQADQFEGGPLEERLRSLILTGSDANSNRASPNIPSNPANFTNNMPPGLYSAGGDELEADQTFPNASRQVSRAGKKRLNQAQRRQMNAELTIPVDIGGLSRSSSKQYKPSQHYNEPHPFQHGQQQQQQQQNPISSYAPTYSGNFLSRHVPKASLSYGQIQRDSIQSPSTFSPQSDRQRQQHGVDGVSRGTNDISPDAFGPRGGHHPLQSAVKPNLYNTGGQRKSGFSPEQLDKQCKFLDQLCYQINADIEIAVSEISEKEDFRKYVETICREVVAHHEVRVNGAREFQPGTVQLKCFGSLASGFATKASDMDLGLLSPMSRLSPSSPESPIPRLIEGALLAAGFGARLLTRTRVPIIKLCEKPDIILKQKLQEARKKWEKGIDQEEREPDDDVQDESDPHLASHFSNDTDVQQAPQTPQEPHASGVQAISLPPEELYSLRQSGNQSLASYYSAAKRLLRRLNGRDVTPSNCLDFTKADYILLDRVARAFINGLADSELRERIMSYPSYLTNSLTQLTNYRSLSGVYTMVEGEQLVLSWSKRDISARNPTVDQAYRGLVERWHGLQYSASFGTNPSWFNKELLLAVEALRQYSPLQITQLQQEQHESPTQYHERTNKIAITLSPDSPVPDADTRVQVIHHYIDGIGAADIRNKVRSFASSTGTQALRTVARQHKSLHLANEYERAIEKDLYHPEDIPIIQSYVSILRRTPIAPTQQPAAFDYVVPLKRSEVSIFDYVSRLSDPSSLGPDKSKDRYSDGLEFPKNGVGVQCDINFSAHLALQNTMLLRCYSYTDPRVAPLILFVKHWAKSRGINTPYRGTLSSYGYVLMVLHYLVNIVEPFVCANLQQLAPPDPDLPPEALEGITTCQGYNVRFWKDEQDIRRLAELGQLTHNRDSLGSLLRGFFEYYAQGNTVVSRNKRGFDWGRDVLSLRTHGGLLSKTYKGWTGAKTVVQPQTGALPTESGRSAALSPDGEAQWAAEQQTAKPKDVKEVRHRFLFAIEDPFELDHNVARTVTHNGIVSIRNEFRRAWAIIKSAGDGHATDDLFEDVNLQKEQIEKQQFLSLLKEIHGNELFENYREP
ncbi:hypothetical protein GGR50DRAFT_691702 [Xylaria sp. CBS 124048]|nr:hypothetical protein GGR50DRAFT_691702 [Xylaria sp. CBS 124048]